MINLPRLNFLHKLEKMAIPFSEIMEIKRFLMQQHIIVSEEWTEACIAFVKQEQGSLNISVQSLKNCVYQQWLVADLEEICCSSLPQQLPTLQKITLNKDFALQVQGIRDISKPAYSQLKQLEGSVNSNADFSSAPQASIPEWEAKPTRMLMLNLTDGCTHIQGMEYKTINFLSPNLPPGIKVLIKSPVDCRLGVLLLGPDNLKILGGEVESKLQQYSRESLLKQQLQLPIDEDNEIEPSSESSARVSSNQESFYDSRNQLPPDNSYRNQQISNHSNRNEAVPNSSRTSSYNSYNNSMPRNQPNTRNSHHMTLPANSSVDNREDDTDMLESFGSDDDFEQNIDYEKIDEIENSQRQVNEYVIPEALEDDCDIWQEDEDMVRDMMEFQDQNLEFEIPFRMLEESSSRNGASQGHQCQEVFSYLSTVVNIPSTDCVITIKGFIYTVLSKLECTASKGWSLLVKINDGTATVDANIHDKVLENIIGVSAQDMMKKQILAAKNPEIRKEVMEAISKCKQTLQNYNCLMDVKLTPEEKPCIIKCYPITKLHIQQMLERARSSV